MRCMSLYSYANYFVQKSRYEQYFESDVYLSDLSGLGHQASILYSQHLQGYGGT